MKEQLAERQDEALRENHLAVEVAAVHLLQHLAAASTGREDLVGGDGDDLLDAGILCL
ncbi:MAG: hypothetical protein ACP5HS_10850 [Anaerolineae bacterium]